MGGRATGPVGGLSGAAFDTVFWPFPIVSSFVFLGAEAAATSAGAGVPAVVAPPAAVAA